MLGIRKGSRFQTPRAVLLFRDDFTIVPLKISAAFLPFQTIYRHCFLQNFYFHRWIIWGNFLQREFVIHKLKCIIECKSKALKISENLHEQMTNI